MIIWTDHGTVPHISTADMAGKNPEIIVSEDIKWPNGLALDYTGKYYMTVNL